MSKKYLIFGATGAVGSSLSKLLKDESLEAHLVGKNEEEISKLAGDLIYCVSILGITGSKIADNNLLEAYLSRVNKYSSCPFIVGFGISDRSDVININQMAHGAVVGSAIINELKKSDNPAGIVKNYIDKLIT